MTARGCKDKQIQVILDSCQESNIVYVKHPDHLLAQNKSLAIIVIQMNKNIISLEWV